jgi:CRP-like cAMP-binding protein
VNHEEITSETEHLEIFHGIPNEMRAKLLALTSPRITGYPKNSIVLAQGKAYDSLHVLLSGECYAEMLDSRGKVLRLETFVAPYSFAPAVLFASDNRMPGSVQTMTACRIAVFSREDILKLCSKSELVLENLLRAVSDRFIFLSRRISFLSFRTIRGKVVHYLRNLTAIKTGDAETNGRGTVRLDMSQEKLAEYFGVTRPALSRVFGSLEEEGCIVRRGREIEIISIEDE